MTDSPSLARRIYHELPRPGDIVRFARQLRHATRASAWRGLIDGMRVAYKLRTAGVRSLVPLESRSNGDVDVERATRVSAAVDAGLALIPVTATCLRRSVTLLRELERLGLAGDLHIGVRGVPTKIEAHAWIQVGSAVVNDDPVLTATYVELAAGKLEEIMPALQ